MIDFYKPSKIKVGYVKFLRSILRSVSFRGRFRLGKLLTLIALPNRKVLLPIEQGGDMIFDLSND